MNPHFDVMGMEVFEVHGDFEAYMPLLLDADPSRELVEKYLMKGKLWACADERGPVCEALMMPTAAREIELMNLCTREDMRGRGIAHAMVRAMQQMHATDYDVMRVGTAYGFPNLQNFYESCGFTLIGIDRGFFVRNYAEPVMDSGRQCVDMARYAMYLK